MEVAREITQDVVLLGNKLFALYQRSGGSPLLQQGGAGLQSSGEAVPSERMGFSPGFFEAGAKAHNQSQPHFRNAEALLPSAKAEGSNRMSLSSLIRTSLTFSLPEGTRSHRRVSLAGTFT
jgi:hypothetical protein